MRRSRSLAQGAFLLASLSILTRCGARTGLEPGELVPMCAGLVVQDVRFGTVKQMDLLFMIDNSRSMADKQELLRDAIPPLVRRLANPLCVSATNPDDQVPVGSVSAPCPNGFVREFEPVSDLHIGVITSSIGSAGGLACTNGEAQNDFGRLLGSRPRAASVRTYQGRGFLDWDPARQHLPPGEADIEELERNFASLVTLAGEDGCGLEASLESWYRFLIDPAPPERYIVKDGVTSAEGIDRTLLAQRAQFLRPDSSVAIVMLSDENDCSIAASGSGWVVGTAALNGAALRLPRGTSACSNDPNSPCCRSCASTAKAPSGCLEVAKDSECSRPQTEDSTNLRCLEQKRRFGFDLLYPTSRYAVGLANRSLCPDSIYQDADCACTFVRERARRLNQPEPPCGSRETGRQVKNPLYDNLSNEVAFDRDSSQVILAGIIGVPWQDIATPETLTDPARLEYLPAAKLAEKDAKLGFDRWALILGDPISGTRPLDPFMIESIAPRSGANPLTQDSIVPASSNPLANAINGHEHPTDENDLQYACTFKLAAPRDCTDAANAIGCECILSSSSTNSLCQDPDGSGRELAQFFAKAYPSLRELDVLRQVGSKAVVASICPKTLVGAPNGEVEFGYRPAVAGIVSRLRCSNLDARFDENRASPDFGTVNCRLVGLRENVTTCDCSGSTRRSLREDDALALRLKLESARLCGARVGRSCDDFCACEIPQTRGAALTACQNDADETPLDPATSAPIDGWCYVDPDGGFGSKELVQACPAANARDLRLLGNGAPQSDERLLAICGDSCDAASK